MTNRLKLWAICDVRNERLDLGLANPDNNIKLNPNIPSTALPSREHVIGRVLIFTTYWGLWKGVRIRLVAGGTPESIHMRDATEDIVSDYILKNPLDEIAKIVLTGQAKQKAPAGPEIMLTLHNGVYEALGESL